MKTKFETLTELYNEYDSKMEQSKMEFELHGDSDKYKELLAEAKLLFEKWHIGYFEKPPVYANQS